MVLIVSFVLGIYSSKWDRN